MSELIIEEEVNSGRLHDLSAVAPVVDTIRFKYPVGRSFVTVNLLVSLFIDGQNLDDHLRLEHSRDDIRFCGLAEEEFFRFAIQLADGLRGIHARFVVHGDIWPQNIRVRPDGTLVYIDFGQAVFREGMIDRLRGSGANSRYQAPEGSKSISGDIYSLGGVLFHLATGDHPPEPIRDGNLLKREILASIREKNPELHATNPGIANVIARCLRYEQYDSQGRARISDAHQLLRELETFREPSQIGVSIENEADQLSASVTGMSAKTNPLFLRMASLLLANVRETLGDMANGIYDLVGDRDQIENAVIQYLSLLGEGDQYLTITIPRYWWPDNMGGDDRFLIVNQLAAQRGAVVRRLFLINADERQHDRHLKAILGSHVRVMREIELYAEQHRSNGKYEARVYNGDDVQQADVTRKHFGLVLKSGVPIAMFPEYRADGRLVAIRFRAGQELVGRLQDEFERMMKDSDSVDFMLHQFDAASRVGRNLRPPFIPPD